MFIYLGSGILFFLSVYLSFEFWYDKVWGSTLRIRDQTLAVYEDIFVDKTPEKVLNEILLISIPFSLLFSLLLFPHYIMMIIMFFLNFWWTRKILYWYQNSIIRAGRIKLFTTQLLDALILMTNALKSGLNVSQALQIVVDEMPTPISQEFNLVLSENKVGVTLEKAFDNLAKRIPTEDVNMFVTSVNILRETGGNLAETFDTIANTIRERFKLQSKIAAMTAQGMTSAVIMLCMPWGIGGLMYFIDPVMSRPLFTTIPGFLILGVILILEVIGYFVIIKIVNFRV
ncbi:MAG: type II secretion system F family protein [Proteobacteria bacterium]|nr:type II secretion system F family protein [Pseudomonadota bacterium]